ncbi:helix-turn-helix domain-containing protein [uncultured Eubacterium sp.]|uniref:helix-turn-helix domain-containing protein n=1 Tax=uncultured Eubacterium sp. TaxID=165185 RepID=UPI002672C982|nr:helix-turn-helix transcriptional regulator [uncultured Eubacterium sp.]
MMNAYDKIYLESARKSLARMCDYAVYDLKYDLEEFFDMFIKSSYAKRFEHGESNVVAGHSGVELAYDILDETGKLSLRIEPQYTMNKSKEYWLGWALAYYQWYTGLSFAEIIKYVPIKKILKLYSPYHEMDVRHFVDKMNELYWETKKETNLKIRRKKLGISQSKLAELTGIAVRTIQQYEQRQRDINKAKAEYLVILARVLYCNVEDLMEKV